MPAATNGWMGRARSTTPARAPSTVPEIWVRQDSRDSLKVGCTAAIAPSMAKMSLEEVAP